MDVSLVELDVWLAVLRTNWTFIPGWDISGLLFVVPSHQGTPFILSSYLYHFQGFPPLDTPFALLRINKYVKVYILNCRISHLCIPPAPKRILYMYLPEWNFLPLGSLAVFIFAISICHKTLCKGAG